MKAITQIKLSKKKLVSLFSDHVKSAEAINLVYVSDKEPGIVRISKRGTFSYLYSKTKITDANTLTRIKSLVLPPAWRHVWICQKENGHLQATGIDGKNRKQYKYHPLWNTLRNHTKFYHLYHFGKALPMIRKQIACDLNKPGLPLQKVLAAVVSVMQHTCTRIGSSQYEQLYGSFGLTTLKDNHVSLNEGSLRFSFIGKKGVHQDITLKNKRLVNIVKQCRDIPGKELFQYYDDQGLRHPIDSGMLNGYIKQISGGQFTAKDFRTWEGTLHAIEAFKGLGGCDTVTGIRKNIVTALDMVAKKLGNTRAVCKKYYVHPIVIDHYTNNTISRYLEKMSAHECEGQTGLNNAEQVLMRMLKKEGRVVIAA
jgi:DNA topoisomerase-1